jgi:hypothetical protein
MISRKLQIAVLLLILAALAMGFYAVYLKRKAEEVRGKQAIHEIAPPLTGPAGQADLWFASDQDGTVRAKTVQVALPAEPAMHAQQALHIFLADCTEKDATHPLPAGSDVRSVYLLDQNSAVVDLSRVLAEQHRSGIQVEQLTVYSMVMTISSALPRVTRVKFLVDGHERPTLAGHIDLQDWLDVPTVAQAVRALDAK